MDVEAVTTFFALLAVVGLLFVAVVAVGAIVGRARGSLPPALAAGRDAVAPVALHLALAVALTSTLGSLYLSEVANFPPCPLCWYQRICMYPNVVLLAVAILRRDRGVARYVVPLATIGLAISVYHYAVEWLQVESFACSAEVSCSTVWFRRFGFLSIPAMAGVGFLLLITLTLLARRGPAPTGPAAGATDRQTTEVRT